MSNPHPAMCGLQKNFKDSREPLYSVRDVAELIGTSTSYVARLARTGKMPPQDGAGAGFQQLAADAKGALPRLLPFDWKDR